MVDVISGKKLEGRAAALLVPTGEGFQTKPVAAIDMTFTGVEGDSHAGWTRKSDSRTPWYKRDNDIRNVRQVSMVSVEDLAAIAADLDVPTVAAAWIGANVVVEGIPDFSFLPAGTLLFFGDDCVLRVEERNAPCRHAGKAVAIRYEGRDDIELAFPKMAVGRRGVVASVDRPGMARAGAPLKVSVPAQWIY
ncbi:MAG: MOSC domain-containing protein [Pseudomonadota bacterium]